MIYGKIIFIWCFSTKICDVYSGYDRLFRFFTARYDPFEKTRDIEDESTNGPLTRFAVIAGVETVHSLSALKKSRFRTDAGRQNITEGKDRSFSIIESDGGECK